MNAIRALAIGAVLPCSGTAFADIIVDRTSFLSMIEATYENNFNDVISGSAAVLEYTDRAYSYSIESIGSSGGVLKNHDGYVSTESHLDGLLITFTGADVTAIGGNFWSVDGDGVTRDGYLYMELDDGTSSFFSATAPDNFRAFTSQTPIRSVFVDMPDGQGEPGQFWAAMDNFIIGQAIPAPGSFSALGVVGFGLARRRR